MLNGTTVANIYNKCCNLPKITGVTSNDNIVSIIGKDLDITIKNKTMEALEKNNINFSNIDKQNMNISITVDEEDVNKCIKCIHELFFKVGGQENG